MGARLSTARAIGILFIVASATAIIGGLLIAPATGDDLITKAAAHDVQIVSGAVLESILAISVVAIATLLYPILARVSEGTALTYVGVRILEGVLILAGSVSALLGLTVSSHADAGISVPASLGAVVAGAREWTYWLGPMVIFGLGAVILNLLLHQGRLVPGWMSMWGGIGGLLLAASGLLEMYGVSLGGWQAIFTAPIGIQEMVFAVWLISKGLATPEMAPLPEHPLVEVGS